MLVRDEKNIHYLVYYSNQTLLDAKTIYLKKIEKVVLSLISASKKLKPYFQAHHIIVLTDQPLQ